MNVVIVFNTGHELGGWSLMFLILYLFIYQFTYLFNYLFIYLFMFCFYVSFSFLTCNYLKKESNLSTPKKHQIYVE